jgi:hypothetical protein
MIRPVLLSILAMSCGGGASSGEHDYFPLSLGASWTYSVTGQGTKTQRVMSTTTLDGIGEVFMLETSKPDGDRTVSYQQIAGNDVVRYQEEIHRLGNYDGKEVYVPYKLRVSNAFSLPGERRQESYHEQDYDLNDQLVVDLVKNEAWTVEAVETITVPAGTFDGAMRVRRTSQNSASDKTYWFLDGVGKLKESGAGQTEELTSYEL